MAQLPPYTGGTRELGFFVCLLCTEQAGESIMFANPNCYLYCPRWLDCVEPIRTLRLAKQASHLGNPLRKVGMPDACSNFFPTLREAESSSWLYGAVLETRILVKRCPKSEACISFCVFQKGSLSINCCWIVFAEGRRVQGFLLCHLVDNSLHPCVYFSLTIIEPVPYTF